MAHTYALPEVFEVQLAALPRIEAVEYFLAPESLNNNRRYAEVEEYFEVLTS
jgi:hypothetical protein